MVLLKLTVATRVLNEMEYFVAQIGVGQLLNCRRWSIAQLPWLSNSKNPVLTFKVAKREINPKAMGGLGDCGLRNVSCVKCKKNCHIQRLMMRCTVLAQIISAANNKQLHNIRTIIRCSQDIIYHSFNSHPRPNQQLHRSLAVRV